MPVIDMALRTVEAERKLHEDPEFVRAKLDLLQAFLNEAETRRVTIWWHELDLLIRLARKANYQMQGAVRSEGNTPTAAELGRRQ